MSAPQTPTPREVLRIALDDAFGHEADHILAALAGAEYAVVPVEPTRMMWAAGMHECVPRQPDIHAIWRAMLSAAQPRDDALAQAVTAWTEGKSDG